MAKCLPHSYLRVALHERSSAGRTGIAPFCVQTKAETSTAFLWAAGTGKPLKMLAVKAAVKESPAPTVSATFTCGVGKNDFASGVKM